MRKLIMILLPLILLVVGLSGSSVAAVVDSSAYGFTLKFEHASVLPADSLFIWFTRDIGRWWNPDHTWSGKAENLYIEPVANGCFCEKLEPAGSVRHLEVVFVQPGKTLRMTGGLGPLQMMALAGSLTFSLSSDPAKPAISLSYTVGGYFPGGIAAWIPIVDRVLGEQFGRFVKYCEGKAVKKPN